jgi:sortase A
MDKARLKPSTSQLALLCVGILAIGVGAIWWALANIGAHTPESVNAFLGRTIALPFLGQESAGAALEATVESVAVSAADTVPEPHVAPDPQVFDWALYSDYPNEGDLIGTLVIPAVGQSFPIIEGTGDEELKRGVGHFRQSVLPGVEDNCVLSGHRDTVFTRLGELEVGDRLIAETAAGRFIYEIVKIRIVDKDDRTIIVPTDHAVLTVTTCYPFNYVGSAPDRYILTADLVTD